MTVDSKRAIIDYKTSVKGLVGQLLDSFTLDQISHTPIFEDPIVVGKIDDSKIAADDPSRAKLLDITFTDLLNEYLNQYLEKEVSDDEYLHRLLVVLDLSIAIGRKYTIKALAMQVLNSIMLVCLPVDFCVERFGKVFFSKDGISRREALTMQNSLVGKAKPGSTLLQIGNEMMPKLFNQFEEHDIFAAKLRSFIQMAFQIDDKLSLATNWKLNSQSDSYKYVEKSRNWPPITIPHGTKNATELCIYKGYMRMMKWITSSSVESLKKSAQTHPGPVDNIQALAKDISTIGMKFWNDKPKCLYEYPGKILQCDWIQDPDDFITQIHDRCYFQSLLLQVLIVADFIDKQVRNNQLKLQLEDIKQKIITTTDKKDHALFLHVVEDNENTWRTMKLTQFNHPDYSSLPKAEQARRQKFDEFIKTQHENAFAKKKRYFNKYGTPRLSRAWRLETGLPFVKSKLKSRDELLDGYKDSLYNLEGQIESEKGELEKLKKDSDEMEAERLKNEDIVKEAENKNQTEEPKTEPKQETKQEEKQEEEKSQEPAASSVSDDMLESALASKEQTPSKPEEPETTPVKRTLPPTDDGPVKKARKEADELMKRLVDQTEKVHRSKQGVQKSLHDRDTIKWKMLRMNRNCGIWEE